MVDKKIITIILLITFVSAFLVLPTNNAKSAGFDWWYFIDNFIIRPILRKIVNAIENKMINAVNQIATDKLNGGRLPHFITDWRNHILKALGRGNDVFKAILVDTNLCPYFRDALKQIYKADQLGGVIGIQSSSNPPGGEPFQLNNQCSISFNPDAFLRDFNNGGWKAWEEAIQPQNNFYATFFAAMDEQSAQKRLEQKSSSDESIAGQGTLPQRLNNTLAGQGGTEGCSAGWGSTGGFRCILFGRTVTPGKIFDAALTTQLDQKFKTIGGSSEIADMLMAIADAVVNKVSGNLLNYLNLQDYNAPSTGGYVGQAGQTPAPSQACYNASNTQRTDCVAQCDSNYNTCRAAATTPSQILLCDSTRTSCYNTCSTQWQTRNNQCSSLP